MSHLASEGNMLSPKWRLTHCRPCLYDSLERFLLHLTTLEFKSHG